VSKNILNFKNPSTLKISERNFTLETIEKLKPVPKPSTPLSRGRLHSYQNATLLAQRKKENGRISTYRTREGEREEKAKDEMRKNGNKKLYRLDQIYDSAGKKNFALLPLAGMYDIG
jgi:hypothetical protein